MCTCKANYYKSVFSTYVPVISPGRVACCLILEVAQHYLFTNSVMVGDYVCPNWNMLRQTPKNIRCLTTISGNNLMTFYLF